MNYVYDAWQRNGQNLDILLLKKIILKMYLKKLVIVDDKTNADPEFVDVLNDSIYKCGQKPYTSINVNQINKRLIGTAIEDNPKYIKVYNVGQAYCAEIRMERGKVIFSDIGLTKNKIELDSKEIKKAKKNGV